MSHIQSIKNRKKNRKKNSSKNKKINGVYILFLNNEIVYIGKSSNIKLRVIAHIKDKSKTFNSIKFHSFSESDTDIIEVAMIDKYKPRYNKQFKHETSSTLNLIIPDIEKFEDYDISKLMKYRVNGNNLIWKTNMWKVKHKIFGVNIYIEEDSIFNKILSTIFA